jgi:hypothetical protein
MALDIVIATDLILAQFRAQWMADAGAIITPALPADTIVFEALEKDLQRHPRDTGVPWARIAVRHSAGMPAAIGKHRHRRTGTAFVQVFVPFVDGKSYTTCQRLVKVVQDAYEGKRSGGVTFPRVNATERGVEASYYRADVAISFQWDEVK